MIVPTAADVAAEEPEIAEKKIPARFATIPMPPVIQLTKESAKFISLLETPPFDIIEPARINKGIAINGKESLDVTNFCVTMVSGMFPAMEEAAVETINEKAIGNPAAIPMARVTNKMVTVI
jgi:hypothetical protein